MAQGYEIRPGEGGEFLIFFLGGEMGESVDGSEIPKNLE